MFSTPIVLILHKFRFKIKKRIRIRVKKTRIRISCIWLTLQTYEQCCLYGSSCICIKLKGRIRIRIKVISWIRIRIRIKYMEYEPTVFKHLFKVFSLYLECRIRIRIRIKVKGRIRIRISFKVTSRLRRGIRIKVADLHYGLRVPISLIQFAKNLLKNLVRRSLQVQVFVSLALRCPRVREVAAAAMDPAPATASQPGKSRSVLV